MNNDGRPSSRRDFLKSGVTLGTAAVAAMTVNTASAEEEHKLTPFANADVASTTERRANANNILVVVDYQVDFVDGVFGNANAQAIEPAVLAKIQAAKDAGDIIIYTMDTHPAETYAETREGKRVAPHCIAGTEGWELYGSAKEALADALMVKKGTYGSAKLPNIIENIIYQGTNVQNIELIGVATTACVINNAVILLNFFPDINIRVSKSATASKTDEAQTAVLDQLGRFGIEIVA